MHCFELCALLLAVCCLLLAACHVLHYVRDVCGVFWLGDGADGRESGLGDLELAVSCWWRAAALQALSAYVMGIMGKGLAEDAAQQVRKCLMSYEMC
jgi:hypothetical protein